MPSAAAIALVAVAGSAALQAAPEGTPFKHASITVSFAQLLALGMFASVVYNVFIYPKFISPLKDLPQAPGGNAVIGQVKELTKTEPGYLHTKWINTIPNKGLIRYMAQFGEERVMPTSTQAIQELFVQKAYKFTKAAGRAEGTRRVIGHGLLTVIQPAEHKVQRKNLQPAFAFGYIKELYPLFWAKSTELVKKMNADVIKGAPASQWQAVDIGSWAHRATLDVIGIAGIGRDFKSLENPKSELSVAWSLLSEPTERAVKYYLLTRFLPFSLVEALPLERNKELKYGASVLQRDLLATINEKRQAIAAGKEDSVDVITRIMQTGKYTDEELIGHMMNFLGAGHDTTSTSCTWAIYLLCKHPEIQTRLREDLASALPKPLEADTPAELTFNDFSACQYLQAVISEVLRLRPSLDTAGRDVAAPVEIAGQTMPEGSRMQISITAVNRSTDLWGPDATEFKPERWLERDDEGKMRANKTGGAKSNYAFSTFLHGPRSCIGKDFARGELLSLVAALIQTFEFRLQDPNWSPKVMSGGVTTKPVNVVVDVRPVQA